ncbi:BREX-1 system phosphatase PglZ type B [Planctomycetaceae bacterium SH139]
MTLIESIIEGLDTATRCASTEVPPVAVMWTDTKEEWRPLIDHLRGRLPQLVQFGKEYDPENLTGPAVWLKCVIERTLPEVNLPADKIPIIYLPGVSRQELRAGTQCPPLLQPLVELLYRGSVWTQKNGKDWTVEAMLVAKERPGLGLDVAGDTNTKRSMLASLSVLAVTPVARMQGRRLESEDFDKLMIGDHPRDLLRWMSDPEGIRKEMDAGQWHAFCNRCRDEYGFDPDSDGELVAGEKFGLQETSQWEGLWSRFRESPSSYQTLEGLLGRAKPSGRVDVGFDREAWPDENDQDEAALRKSLAGLDGVDARSARVEISKLEKHHGVRRAWVWATLGKAPLAHALAHLNDLAHRTASHLGGDSRDDLEKQYVESGYLVDDAALRALASVKTATDSSAVELAVRAMYLPWLEQAAERLQELVQDNPLPTSLSSDRPEVVSAEVGSCILFADGLRYDLAQRLSVVLAERGLRVEESRRWAALPSVTATAKPAVTPIVKKITGVGIPDSFMPELADDPGKSLTFARLQSLLKTEGYQIIPTGEVGEPTAKKARGWCEFGDIDKRGHSLQVKLASIIEQQVELLADRIDELLSAGWRQVRVVTDHGWLLMPGGLPKEDLPRYLTEAKWSRCATIKGESNPNVPKVPWYWNPQAEFASAPGIRCFSAGHFYQHGGISLQECLIADLTVGPDSLPSRLEASITKVDWKGLKCRITVEPVSSGLRVDLRSKPNDSGSSITDGGKPLDGSPTVTLFVENEDLEGTVVAIVVCDENGQLIAKQNTTIGGDN